MSDTPTDIAQLVDDLQSASKAFREAAQRTSYAKNDENTALNEVNRLQKLLDGAIEAVRNEAPNATNWKENQRRLKGERA
jgi:ABC-type transporter Mla subunit MlaD